MSIKAHQDNRENTDKFTLHYSKAIDKVCKNTEKIGTSCQNDSNITEKV